MDMWEYGTMRDDPIARGADAPHALTRRRGRSA